MKLTDLSVTFHTSKVRECADFYVRYLGAEVAFDAGWYISVRFKSDVNSCMFLSFQDAVRTGRKEAQGTTSLNMMVDDVDAEYEKMKRMGIAFEEEITDHTWGDRAFSMLDPIGNVVYIYSERPIGDEYQDAVKQL